MSACIFGAQPRGLQIVGIAKAPGRAVAIARACWPSRNRRVSESGFMTQKKDRSAHSLNGLMVWWWSWRELNPRPQAFSAQFYMFSALFWISPPMSRRRTLHQPPVPYVLVPTQGTRIRTSQCGFPHSLELAPLAQPIGQLL